MTFESTDYTHCLDLTGLTCPLLLIKMKQSLKQLKTDERLWVKVDDPNAERDFNAYIATTSHVIRTQKQADCWYFFITKKAPLLVTQDC